MKRLILAIAMTASTQALGKAIAFPAYGCHLKAKITNSSGVELLLVRGENLVGSGVVVCTDAVGQKVKRKVSVELHTVGIGPAFNLPAEGLDLVAVRAGLVTTDGMVGQYNLSVGPRLGLLAARVGVMAGVQVSGEGAGLGIEALIENRLSVGLDLGGVIMIVR